MRLILIAFGSRGDVQPMIALGRGLRAAGYTIIIAAGENFRQWITDEGFEFQPFRLDIEQVMQSDAGQSWSNEASSDPMTEIRSMKAMVRSMQETVIEDIWRIAQYGDVLLSSFLSVGFAHNISQKTGKRHLHLLLQPITPSHYGEATMRPAFAQRYSLLNLPPAYIAQGVLWEVYGEAINYMRQGLLKLPAMTRADFIHMWNHVPTLYGISSLVMPRDPQWGDHLHITGYWVYDQATGYTPPDALAQFLAAGQAPVYIGFGSMSNRDPQATTRILIEAIQRSGQRAVIYSGWAGLNAADLPETIYLLNENVPHDWLFPRMAALVHHGGAGTTAAGLRAGVPSMAVAHLGDQFYWGRRLAELGVGAPAILRHQLTVDRLTNALTRMTSSAGIKQKAAQVGALIQQEDGVANAVNVIRQYLPLR